MKCRSATVEAVVGARTSGGGVPGRGGHKAGRARTAWRGSRAVLGLLWTAALGWLAIGAGGCEESATEAFCKKRCACLGPCDPGGVEECVALMDAGRADAEEVSCDQEFDTYYRCLADQWLCGVTPLVVCQEESEKYDSCGANDPRCLPAQDKIAAAYEACGEDPAWVYARKCTERNRAFFDCVAPCYEIPPCGAITHEDGDAELKLRECSQACGDED